MAWARMRFRVGLVFVKTDESGQLILDSDGRAEMKYRTEDPRSYRPSPDNLASADAAGAPAGANAGARSSTTGTTRARKSAPKAGSPSASVPAPQEGEVAIWTDGACTGNPGPMGIGMVVIVGDRRIERGEYLGIGTNNIAELVAIERGLDMAEEAHPGVAGTDAETPVRVYSDSGYSIGVLSMGWKAKANQEIVARIRKRLSDFPRLSFQKVPGHAGVPDNERCDQLARDAIVALGTV